MPYGLKDETLTKITQILTQYPQVEQAILYGSRAKGNYKPGSDIDLTLCGIGIDLHPLNKISLALDDLLLPQTFDISIHQHVTNIALLAQIERVGKVIYESKQAVIMRMPQK